MQEPIVPSQPETVLQSDYSPSLTSMASLTRPMPPDMVSSFPQGDSQHGKKNRLFNKIDLLMDSNYQSQLRGNNRGEPFVGYQNPKQSSRSDQEIRNSVLDTRFVTSPDEGLRELQSEQLKRPLSPFNYFNRDRFSQIHKEDPTKPSTRVFKEVGYKK